METIFKKLFIKKINKFIKSILVKRFEIIFKGEEKFEVI